MLDLLDSLPGLPERLDVPANRTGIQRGAAAQRPTERPTPLGKLHAFQDRV
jgi:hypothetical protein